MDIKVDHVSKAYGEQAGTARLVLCFSGRENHLYQRKIRMWQNNTDPASSVDWMFLIRGK